MKEKDGGSKQSSSISRKTDHEFLLTKEQIYKVNPATLQSWFPSKSLATIKKNPLIINKKPSQKH